MSFNETNVDYSPLVPLYRRYSLCVYVCLQPVIIGAARVYVPQREHNDKVTCKKADPSLPEERQEQDPIGGDSGVRKRISAQIEHQIS